MCGLCRPANGTLAPASGVGRAMHDEALVTDAHVCFTCDNGLLYTLDRATGREVWRHDLGDPQVARVLLHTVRPSAGTR